MPVLSENRSVMETGKGCDHVEWFEDRAKLTYLDGPAHRLLPNAASKLVIISFRLVSFDRLTVTMIG
jgi:hypothetical protein